MLFHALLFLLVTVISNIYALTIPEQKAAELSLVARANNTVNVNQTSEGFKSVSVYCGCGFDMNRANTDQAVARLKDELQLWVDSDSYIPPRQKIFSIVGDVVAFFCNGDKDVRVDVRELPEATTHITQHCGLYIAGTERSTFLSVFPTVRKDHYDLGYMRYRPGLDFCHDATTSPVDHC